MRRWLRTPRQVIFRGFDESHVHNVARTFFLWKEKKSSNHDWNISISTPSRRRANITNKRYSLLNSYYSRSWFVRFDSKAATNICQIILPFLDCLHYITCIRSALPNEMRVDKWKRCSVRLTHSWQQQQTVNQMCKKLKLNKHTRKREREKRVHGERRAPLLPMIYGEKDFSHSVERARDIQRVCFVRVHIIICLLVRTSGEFWRWSRLRFLLFLLRIYHVHCCDDCEVARDFRSRGRASSYEKLPNVSCNNSQRCHRACINNVDREHYNHQRAHSTPLKPIHIAQADKSLFISLQQQN